LILEKQAMRSLDADLQPGEDPILIKLFNSLPEGPQYVGEFKANLDRIQGSRHTLLHAGLAATDPHYTDSGQIFFNKVVATSHLPPDMVNNLRRKSRSKRPRLAGSVLFRSVKVLATMQDLDRELDGELAHPSSPLADSAAFTRLEGKARTAAYVSFVLNGRRLPEALLPPPPPAAAQLDHVEPPPTPET
jgi:hypothetical protein